MPHVTRDPRLGVERVAIISEWFREAIRTPQVTLDPHLGIERVEHARLMSRARARGDGVVLVYTYGGDAERWVREDTSSARDARHLLQ